MIVDTSALVAILVREEEGRAFALSISRAETRAVAAGSWVELATVLVRRFGVAEPTPVMARLRHELSMEVTATTAEQALLATTGYATFGKGSGHRAGLNFGDCFAYALAIATGEPLLFKGDDFNHTDVRRHEASSYPR